MLENADLEKVCKLAKIRVLDSEKEAFLAKLNSVLNWIEQLEAIDVSGASLDEACLNYSTFERPDSPESANSKDELLSNTKHKKFDMFCVPKIVE
ncbi:hypothetical protein FACS1894113_1470 [Alphaproteobacteria bacterium]|nr:hypothetical protein FACS1894113_1470 [Alphaproteobacteria bacterium]